MKLMSQCNFIYKSDDTSHYLYSPISFPHSTYPSYEVSSNFIDKIYLSSMDIKDYISGRLYYTPVTVVKKKIGKKSTLDKLLASDEEDYISILKKEGLI